MKRLGGIENPDLLERFLHQILFINALSGNRFSGKLSSNVLNNMLTNPSFCSSVSFLIV